MSKPGKVAVETPNVPGHKSYVDAEKYHAMREVLLKVIPKDMPGMSQNEMIEAIQPHLPQALWPGGEKSGWWMKSVQLDLEAKGLVKRNASVKPLRWYIE